MKILIFGAGVLGSLYAARLGLAGHAVTILARGQRAADLRRHGIVLEHVPTRTRAIAAVKVIERLEPAEPYDIVMVFVRNDQLTSVLQTIGTYQATASILFMVNNALGPNALIQAVGRDRVLMGLAGAGGMREGHVVRYHVLPAWQQPTTLGELDGRRTARLERITAALQGAGFPVAISGNIDAWLKTHVMWTCPAAHALYMLGGSNYAVAHTPDALVLWIRAVREGFHVLRALGEPVTPPSLRVFELLPEPILVAVLSRLMDTPTAELVIARHANAARAEYVHLGNDFLTLARRSGVPTPAFDRLRPYVDVAVPPLAAGGATLGLEWRELRSWFAALGVLGVLTVLVNRALHAASGCSRR